MNFCGGLWRGYAGEELRTPLKQEISELKRRHAELAGGNAANECLIQIDFL